jgi:hypothetical protein
MQTRGTLAAGGTRWAIVGLVASLVLLGAILPLVHTYAATGLQGPLRGLLAAGFAACGWLAAVSAFRLSLISCAVPPRSVRYIAQASFWMYLFHHPAVGLAQVALHRSGLTAEAKFVLVWVCATGLSLLTYEALVRRTWIGALLNGRREMTPSSAETSVPQRRAA